MQSLAEMQGLDFCIASYAHLCQAALPGFITWSVQVVSQAPAARAGRVAVG